MFSVGEYSYDLFIEKESSQIEGVTTHILTTTDFLL